MPKIADHFNVWSDIESQPQFKALSLEQQSLFKDRYYRRVIIKDPDVTSVMQADPNQAAQIQKDWFGPPTADIPQSKILPLAAKVTEVGFTPTSKLLGKYSITGGKSLEESMEPALLPPASGAGPLGIGGMASDATRMAYQLLDFLQSPVGAVTLGAGAASKIAQKILSGGFTAQMGAGTYEAGKALITDPKNLTKWQQFLASAGMTGFIGGHALKPTPSAIVKKPSQKLLPAAGETSPSQTLSTGRTIISPEGAAMRVSETPAGAIPRAAELFTKEAQQVPQRELSVGPVEGGLRVQDEPLGTMPFETPYQRQLLPQPESKRPGQGETPKPVPSGNIEAPEEVAKLAPVSSPSEAIEKTAIPILSDLSVNQLREAFKVAEPAQREAIVGEARRRGIPEKPLTVKGGARALHELGKVQEATEAELAAKKAERRLADRRVADIGVEIELREAERRAASKAEASIISRLRAPEAGQTAMPRSRLMPQRPQARNARPTGIPEITPGEVSEAEARAFLGVPEKPAKAAGPSLRDTWEEAYKRAEGKQTIAGRPTKAVSEAVKQIRAGQVPEDIKSQSWHRDVERAVMSAEEVRAESRRRAKPKTLSLQGGVKGAEDVKLEETVAAVQRTPEEAAIAKEELARRLETATPEQRKAYEEATGESILPPEAPKTEIPIAKEGLERHVAELTALDEMTKGQYRQMAGWAKVENMAKMRGVTDLLPWMEKYRDQINRHGDADLAADVVNSELKSLPSGETGAVGKGRTVVEGGKSPTQRLKEDIDKYLRNLRHSGHPTSGVVDITEGKPTPEAGWILPDKKTIVDAMEDGHFTTLAMIKGPDFPMGIEAWKNAGQRMKDFIAEGAIRKSAHNSYSAHILDDATKFAIEQDLRNNVTVHKFSPNEHTFIDAAPYYYRIPTHEIVKNGYNLDELLSPPYEFKLKTEPAGVYATESDLKSLALTEEYERFQEKLKYINTVREGLSKKVELARKRSKSTEAGFINLQMLNPANWISGTKAQVAAAAKNLVQSKRTQISLPSGFDPKMEDILRKQSEENAQISFTERLSALPQDTIQKLMNTFVRFPGSRSLTMLGNKRSAGAIEKRLGVPLAEEMNPVRQLQTIRGGYGGHVFGASLRFSDILRRANKSNVAELLDTYLNYRAYDREGNILLDHANRAELKGNTKEAADIRDRLANGEALPMKYTHAEVKDGLDRLINSTDPTIQAAMPKVQALADEVYAVTSQFLEDIKTEGLITQESYAKYKSYGTDYVSLMRDFSDLESHNQSFGRASMDVKTMNLIKKLEGSERVNLKPLDATLLAMRRGYNLAGRNKAMNMLREFRTTDVGGWALEMTPAGKLGKNGQFVWNHDILPPKGFTKIGLFNKGIQETYLMPKELGEVLTNVDPLYTHLGVNILQRAAASVLRSTAVGANIAFTSVNAPRDIFAAAFFKYPGRKIELVPFMKTYVGVIRKGILDTSPERMEYLRAQASFSTMTQAIAPDIMLDMQKGILKNAFTGHPIKAIAQFSGLVEEAPKRATYAQLRKAGLSETQAAVHTRRFGGSPDFAAGGEWKDWLNLTFLFSNARLQGLARNFSYARDNPKRIIQLMTAATVATAALQDWNYQFKDEDGNSIYDQLTEQEKANNWVILMPGVGPITSTGTRNPPRLTLPKPYEVQQAMRPIEKLFEHEIFGTKGWSQQDTLDIVSAFSPIQVNLRQGRVLQTAVEGALSSANPAIGAPLEQTMGPGGYESFYERPIVPERLTGVEREFQYRPSTSGTAQALGRGDIGAGAILGSTIGGVAGGGYGAMAGGLIGAASAPFHPSPLRTEALIRRTTGGLGQSALKAADVLYKTEERGAIPYSRLESRRNIPFIGDVIRRYTGGPLSGIEVEVNDKFYRVASRAQEVRDTLNYLKKKDTTQLEEYLNRSDTMKMLQAEKLTSDIRSRVSQLAALEERIQISKDIEREEKLAQLEQLTKQRESILKSANEILGELLEETK